MPSSNVSMAAPVCPRHSSRSSTMKTLIFVFCALSTVKTKSISNNTAILISKYAKVAHWGSSNNHENSTDNEEGRNSRGQYFWTHRSDANIIGGQNLATKPIAYQYAVYKNPSVDKSDVSPAKGEVVIEDRFEHRPHFAYKSKPDAAPSQQVSKPSPTFDSFPVFTPPKSPKPSVDPYTSPYNSYNAPDVIPDDSPKEQYPPNGTPDDTSAPDSDSYAQPPPDSNDGGNYPPAPQKSPKVPDSYPSVGPPFAPEYNEDQDQDPIPPPPSPVDTMPKFNYGGHGGHGGPPDHPPKGEDDVFYPPEEPMGHPPMMDHGPPPKNHGGDDMVMDLVPPPDDTDQGHPPTYFYDQHGFDNHVYEEVPHTPAPEAGDERVNKGHYSYYYLGRKLWYIPLYFSIYFIIYVGILILKSIARHKVQFKHKFVSDHGKKRESRGMKIDSEKVDEIHRNVDIGIRNATKKYDDVIKM